MTFIATPLPSLSGEHVGKFHVLDRAHSDKSGRLYYWCRCDHCGNQQRARAQNLRKGLRGRWEPYCKVCDA